jgi:hypothetical protein
MWRGLTFFGLTKTVPPFAVKENEVKVLTYFSSSSSPEIVTWSSSISGNSVTLVSSASLLSLQSSLDREASFLSRVEVNVFKLWPQLVQNLAVAEGALVPQLGQYFGVIFNSNTSRYTIYS